MHSNASVRENILIDSRLPNLAVDNVSLRLKKKTVKTVIKFKCSKIAIWILEVDI